MFIRMVKGALIRQRGKMFLIAFTIALGASLATAMLNTMLDVGDKVNAELKTYGANITVKPKDSSLLADLYSVEEEGGSALSTSYLAEDELGKLKTIFWAFNIVDFSPFLETQVTVDDSQSAAVVGTWFNHHLDLPTGESLDAGISGLRSWWEIKEGAWIDEQNKSADYEVMLGSSLAEKLNAKVGDTLSLTGSASALDVSVVGIYDAGGDEDDKMFAELDLVQALFDLDGKVASIEVSALTTPDNELALRAAKNPAALSAADYETWYCTAYVSSICYQIQEAITNSSASAVRQVADSEGAILDKTKLLMLLITILSLIGAALGISNLVTASVMERAQELGLLKAIGAFDGPITALIMTEVLITALVGGVAGYFMGFGFAQLIGQSVFGSAIEMKVMVIPIVALLIALVTIAGSLPAIRMVLRLDPAEVLHGSKA
ncbi:MAG: ABC transporter permease [Eubacteriales bacterium]|nr:ABC transporter permease [Eubacteriales bacterium]